MSHLSWPCHRHSGHHLSNCPHTSISDHWSHTSHTTISCHSYIPFVLPYPPKHLLLLNYRSYLHYFIFKLPFFNFFLPNIMTIYNSHPKNVHRPLQQSRPLLFSRGHLRPVQLIHRRSFQHVPSHKICSLCFARQWVYLERDHLHSKVSPTIYLVSCCCRLCI
jgi:hypothetical protein